MKQFYLLNKIIMSTEVLGMKRNLCKINRKVEGYPFQANDLREVAKYKMLISLKRPKHNSSFVAGFNNNELKD